jgi:hypothetical protein
LAVADGSTTAVYCKKFAEVFGRNQETSETGKPPSVPMLKKSKLLTTAKQVDLDLALQTVNNDPNICTVQCTKHVYIVVFIE